MGAGYQALGMRGIATFSLFVRKLPANRSFLVAAGLEDALERVARFQFDDEAIRYLRSVGQIREEFLESLPDLRFSGDVWAVPEGRVVFPDEPLLEVQAPIIEAQLVETLIVNAIHFPSLVATKAARCVAAAPNATLIDFGLRRTPSLDAGLAVARASYLAGFDATSNVLAGERYDIPVAGTVAHSFIETFPSEVEAFLAFGETFPGPVTLLIDTYDTVTGAQHAAQVARKLQERGQMVAAVRIDSGDLGQHSRAVRRVLDDAGLEAVRIVASGGLDEYELAELTRAGSPIDAYGVGTRLGTSADAPNLDMAYKLVEYDNRSCLKLSEGKQTLVDAKQVWRRQTQDGFIKDRIAARDEPSPGDDWEPLLAPVMRGGQLIGRPSLTEIRQLHRTELSRLPSRLLDLNGQVQFPVELSAVLAARQAAAERLIRDREGLPRSPTPAGGSTTTHPEST